MRIVLIFLFLLGCSGLSGEKTKKIYICGDHECSNKKEVNDYFKNNISVEVYTVTISSKKDRDYDLVQLNMSTDEQKQIVKYDNQVKDLKENLKKRKQISKLKIQDGEKIQQIRNRDKKPKVTLVRICKNLYECDIDNVQKIITKMGNQKKFPNLTVK